MHWNFKQAIEEEQYLIPLSLALLSCRSMRLCRISSTSCLSSESSMSEGDSNGSRKGAGSALLIVVALYPEVTCSLFQIKFMWHYRIVRINHSCHFLVGLLWHPQGRFKLNFCINFENA